MFGGRFNRLPFNRRAPASEHVIIGRGRPVEIATQLSGRFIRDLRGRGTPAEIETELSGRFVRELVGRGVTAEIATQLSARFIRDIRVRGVPAEIIVESSGDGFRSRVERITLTVNLNPGEKALLDSRLFKTTKNGAFAGYDGDFITIYPGDNRLAYTDASPSRQLHMRVTYRDKYM